MFMPLVHFPLRILSHRFYQRIFLACAATLIALVLYGYDSHPYQDVDTTYYQWLGEAFLSGLTYFESVKSPELLALKNTYNWVARLPVSALWYASLYNGRYYLYFGPVPVLSLWIPVQWLTGVSLSDRQMTFFFCLTGTSFFVWLLALMARRQPPILQWGILFAIMAVCFGTWIPLLLHRPSFYEAAIGGAYCFTVLGILCLWNNRDFPESQSVHWKLLGSLCFGLAASCRLFYACNAIILLTIWLSTIKHRSGWKAHLYEALYLGTPWSLCMAALAAYNYARFGSIFETGLRYQLTLTDYHNGYTHYWQWPHVRHHIYEYFFKPLPITTLLPWGSTFGKVIAWDIPYGLWTNSPFSLWSLWFFFNNRACKSWLGDRHSLVIGITLYTIVITLFLFIFRYSVNRFMVDFSPWMMLLAALGYMHALQSSPKRWQPALLTAGGITALLSVYTGIAGNYCDFESCI